MDWGEVFWILHRAFPHYFTEETFGDRPLHIIADALKRWDRMQAEQAARFSDATAQLSAAYHRANGAKQATPLELNPHRKALRVADAKAEIPPEAARVALELMGESKIPYWAMEQLEPDMERLRMAAL